MSSAMNHRRRSHRSEMRKGGVYRPSMRKWHHSMAAKRSVLGGLLGLLRRRKPAEKRQKAVDQKRREG